MSVSIYDLSEQELLLKSMLFCLDPEDKEDVAQIELIELQLDAIDTSAQRKILWRVRVLKELQASLEAVEERKKHIERKRVVAQNAVNRMKANIADCMEMFELDRVQDDEFNVSYKTNGATAKVIGLENIDPFWNDLPTNCWETIPASRKPVLNNIKAYLKSGAEINGLSLEIGKTLRIS
jgi:hypothetical protein